MKVSWSACEIFSGPSFITKHKITFTKPSFVWHKVRCMRYQVRIDDRLILMACQLV